MVQAISINKLLYEFYANEKKISNMELHTLRTAFAFLCMRQFQIL